MAEPFLGEIKMTGFAFAPKGWALCNGQQLPISQNQALFSLFGTTYGGDGRTTFALPNLQGRTPIHQSSGSTMGASGGEASHTLLPTEMPNHVHQLSASSSVGSQPVPMDAYLGQAAPANPYAAAGGTDTMSAATIASAGWCQPHSNMQPYLTVTFCVALVGIFPSRN
jgi:microcystin-dependent protein